MAKIMVLNGPNLNLLGSREPQIYGSTTLQEINQNLTTFASKHGHELACYQSNSEAELIEHIHSASQRSIDCIIMNPAAFTHTSVALRDALLAVNIPFIEVHLSNIFRREPFRQHSYFSDIAIGIISGMGEKGYELALLAADNYLIQKSE